MWKYLRQFHPLYQSSTQSPRQSQSPSTRRVYPLSADQLPNSLPAEQHAKKKRKKFDPESREKVERVRTSGFCLRCRICRLKVKWTSPFIKVRRELNRNATAMRIARAADSWQLLLLPRYLNSHVAESRWGLSIHSEQATRNRVTRCQRFQNYNGHRMCRAAS